MKLNIQWKKVLSGMSEQIAFIGNVVISKQARI